jgi:tRNA pseudouridine55 synthase
MSPSGLLLVDKPEGPTSHDVIRWIRKAAGVRRVGHAGTLDPFASGLLLVLLGAATRLSEYLLGMDKEYQATVRLGTETSTHDPEGDVVFESPAWQELGMEEVDGALAGFRGPIQQKPPVYSAKKVQGDAAHKRVRRGEKVNLEPVPVTVFGLELEEVDLPELKLHVHCSSGTYIRALARDLGRALGVGGHLTALRRTAVGPHSVQSALLPDALSESEAIWENLASPAETLGHFPDFVVNQDEAARIRHGQFLPLPAEAVPAEGLVRVLLQGELVAVAAWREGQLRPQKVFGVEN